MDNKESQIRDGKATVRAIKSELDGDYRKKSKILHEGCIFAKQ